MVASNSFKDDFDHQAAAGANSYIFAIAEVLQQDLELITARTWVGVERCSFVEDHILDFNLVVDRHLERCFVYFDWVEARQM